MIIARDSAPACISWRQQGAGAPYPTLWIFHRAPAPISTDSFSIGTTSIEILRIPITRHIPIDSVSNENHLSLPVSKLSSYRKRGVPMAAYGVRDGCAPPEVIGARLRPPAVCVMGAHPPKGMHVSGESMTAPPPAKQGNAPHLLRVLGARPPKM